MRSVAPAVAVGAPRANAATIHPDERERGHQQQREKRHQAPLGRDPFRRRVAGGRERRRPHLVARHDHQRKRSRQHDGGCPDDPGGPPRWNCERHHDERCQSQDDAAGQRERGSNILAHEPHHCLLRQCGQPPDARDQVDGRRRHEPPASAPHGPAAELRVAALAAEADVRHGEPGHRQRTEHDVQEAGKERRIPDVQVGRPLVGQEHRHEPIRPDRQAHVVHVDEGDRRQAHDDQPADDPAAARRRGLPERQPVRQAVPENQHRNHGEPEPADEDRAHEEQPPVQCLEEEQRGDAQRDGRRNQHRHRRGDPRGEFRVVRPIAAPAAHPRHRTDDRPAEHDVHRQQVQEEQHHQKDPQQRGRRGLPERIRHRDRTDPCGHHRRPSLSRAPVPSVATYAATARR